MTTLNPRLILSYLNTQAIIHRTPQIEVEASLPAFLERVDLSAGGSTIRAIKDQLKRLAKSRVATWSADTGNRISDAAKKLGK